MDRQLTPLSLKQPLLWIVAVFCLLIITFFSQDTNAQTQQERQNYQLDDPFGGGEAGYNVTGNFTIEDDGDRTRLEVNDNFSCNTSGQPVGDLFINPQCGFAGGLGIFANVICRVENLFGNILALVYCSVQVAIVPPFLALLSLYVIIYGAMVILGMVRQNIREAVLRIVKLALVGAIVLNADIAINVAYKFYIGFAQSAMTMVFDIFDTEAPVAGGIYESNAYQENVEAGYIVSPVAADPSRQLISGEHWMHGMDATVNKAISVFINGGVGMITFLILLAIFAFPVFAVLLYLVYSVFKAFATAIIGYLLGLLGLTLLFALSPIFVSFALFEITKGWFNTWLKYLASFTLQIIIVMTFLMLMLMVDIFTFFGQVGDLFRVYVTTPSFGFLYFHPMNIYTLCKIQRTGSDPFGNNPGGEAKYFPYDMVGSGPDLREAPADDAHLIDGVARTSFNGFPRCIPEYDLDAILAASDPEAPEVIANLRLPPGLSVERLQELRENISNQDLAEYFNDESQSPEIEIIANILAEANQDLTYRFLELFQATELLGFILVRLMVVIVLSFLLERFLQRIPHMANVLAGTRFSGRLTGENIDFHSYGIQDSRDWAGLDTGYANFKKAALGGNRMMSSPRKLVRGIGAGVRGSLAATREKTFESAVTLSSSNAQILGQSQKILEEQRAGLWADEHKTSGDASGITRGTSRDSKKSKRQYAGGLDQKSNRRKARQAKKARQTLGGDPSQTSNQARPSRNRRKRGIGF